MAERHPLTERAPATHTAATERTASELATRRSTAAQWFGVLAGPLAMLSNLQVQYALVPWACFTGARFTLHVAALLFLAIAVAPAFVARREWRTAGGGEPDDEGGTLARTRFLGVVGMATSVFFAVVILAMWLANAFLNTCHGS
ncbi:MAG: hypothetical protein M3303_02195 [Gemmatimonadota bacterium]|nr:hypothetical protein [Gemmatimonadota bacterium]